mmetsp:Transcript_50438/g.131034  ORF Transcript_50438/g.131034 Transcript_50438/m.131034 type:complete len:205 (-) Transcript_50438:172-786(-)
MYAAASAACSPFSDDFPDAAGSPAAAPSDWPSETSRIILAVSLIVGREPSSANIHCPSAYRKSPPSRRMVWLSVFCMFRCSLPAVKRSACASPRRRYAVSGVPGSRRASPASTATVTSRAGTSCSVSADSARIVRNDRGAVELLERRSFLDLISSSRTRLGSAGSKATACDPPSSLRRSPAKAVYVAAAHARYRGQASEAAGGG